jgi:hypothetical protein
VPSKTIHLASAGIEFAVSGSQAPARVPDEEEKCRQVVGDRSPPFLLLALDFGEMYSLRHRTHRTDILTEATGHEHLNGNHSYDNTRNGGRCEESEKKD